MKRLLCRRNKAENKELPKNLKTNLKPFLSKEALQRVEDGKLEPLVYKLTDIFFFIKCYAEKGDFSFSPTFTKACKSKRLTWFSSILLLPPVSSPVIRPRPQLWTEPLSSWVERDQTFV